MILEYGEVKYEVPDEDFYWAEHTFRLNPSFKSLEILAPCITGSVDDSDKTRLRFGRSEGEAFCSIVDCRGIQLEVVSIDA